jgi:uncharacterized protein
MTATETAVKPYLLTTSMTKFPYLDPKPEHIMFDDIVTAMSRIYRFGGHGAFGFPLLVHCGLGSEIMYRTGFGIDAVKCFMMHDAHEAYTGDWPTPLKDLFPEIREMQKQIDKAISLRFSISLHANEDTTKFMDKMMFAMEARAVYPSLPDDHSAHRVDVPSSLRSLFDEHLDAWLDDPKRMYLKFWSSLG